MIKRITIIVILFALNVPAQWVSTNSPANLTCGKVIEKGGFIFVGTDGQGVFRSSNNGNNWESISNGLASLRTTLLFSTDNYLFSVNQIGSYATIYRSSNSGDTWEPCTVPYYNYVIGIGVYNNTIWVGYYAENRVYKSTDEGTTWTLTTLPWLNIFTYNSNYIFASFGTGFWRSSDGGNNWATTLKNGLPEGQGSYKIIANDEYLFMATINSWGWNIDKVYRSSDHGDNWVEANNGLSTTGDKRDLVIKNGIIYVVCEGEGIFYSTDYGDNWLIFSDESQTPGVTWIEIIDNLFFASSLTGYGIYRSPFESASWTTIINGFPHAPVTFFHTNANTLFAGSMVDGIFRTTNNGLSWTKHGFSNAWTSLTSIDNLVFAGVGSAGVYRSGDNGINWYFLDNGLTNKNIQTIKANQQNLYLGTWYIGAPLPAGGIFTSTDYGGNWTNIGPLTGKIVSITFKDNNIYACDYGTGVVKSTDNGINWITLTNGLSSLYTLYIATNGSSIFVGTDIGIFRSDNDGDTWTNVNSGIPNSEIGAITFFGNIIYIGTNNGVYASGNNGDNWTDMSTGLEDRNVWSLEVSNGYLFAGTSSKGVWRYDTPLPVELTSFTAKVFNDKVRLNWSTATEVNNYGFEIERKTESNWTTIGFIQGNGNSNAPKEYSYNDHNPTGGNKFQYRLKQIDNDGQFKYSETIEVEMFPNDLALYQNYPNPFNPKTQIKFSVLKEIQVNISVFNSLGENVTELKNEIMKPGFYEVEFDASKLSSGVYFYQLKSGDFIQTKKMLLMK